MRERRSGLLAGLLTGFVAMVLCSVVFAGALYAATIMPALGNVGGGYPLGCALGLVTGLLVGLAMRAARPASLLLPLLAALYAALGIAVGAVVFLATLVYDHDERPVIDLSGTIDRLPEALSDLATSGYRQPAVFAGTAALVALLLVATRVRAARRARATVPSAEPETPAEPEYRSAFEPVRPREQATPTGDAFLPKTDRDG